MEFTHEFKIFDGKSVIKQRKIKCLRIKTTHDTLPRIISLSALVEWKHRSFACSIRILQYFTHSRKNNIVSICYEIRYKVALWYDGHINYRLFLFLCFQLYHLFHWIFTIWRNKLSKWQREAKKIRQCFFDCIMKSINKILAMRQFRIYVLFT